MPIIDYQQAATIFQAGFVAGFIVATLLVTSGVGAILRRGWKDDDED